MQKSLFHDKRMCFSVVLLLPVMLSLSVTAIFAQDAAVPAYFYYADGERIPLTVSTEYIAADFAGGGAASTFAQPEGSAATQPGLIAGYDFYLISLQGVGSSDGAVALANSIRASARAEWVNPVFQYRNVTLILTDELVVAFQPGISRAEVDAYAAANGIVFDRELSPDVVIMRATSGAGLDALVVANRIQEEGVALYSAPNWVRILPPQRIPDTPLRDGAAAAEPQSEGGRFFTSNDTYGGWNWHLNNTAQTPDAAFVGLTADADVDGFEAFDINAGSNAVIIAIIDDGVDTDHPDLNDKIVFPRDVVGNDNDPRPIDTAIQQDIDAHGTHVSGIAAAETNNNAGTIGACPNCMLMPIRFAYSINLSGERFTTDAVIAAAFDWARTNGAAVINSSWGVVAPATVISDAIRNAAVNGRGGLGSLVVFSAGDELDPDPSPVLYPGSLVSFTPGMIVVGASTWCDTIKEYTAHLPPDSDDCSGEYWWGAFRGAEVGIAAPGHHLYSPDPVGANGYSGDDLPAVPNNDYTSFNGTGSSAPVVSGIAGLIISANPSFTSDQVRDRIMLTADPIYTTGYDTASGWGRINAQKALNNTATNTGTPNDHLATSAAVTTLPYTNAQTVMGTFVDRGDPAFACLGSGQFGGNTVWRVFTPAYNMTVTISTAGSSYDTVLAVYNDVGTSLACNDDFAGATSQVTFSATAGVSYRIQIGNFDTISSPNSVLSPGTLNLSITTTTPPPTVFTLTGSVTLQGRPTPPHAEWIVPLQVIVKNTVGGAVPFNGTVNTNNQGQFTVSDIPAGTYTVWVKHAHTLANAATVVIAGNTSHNFGTLREGDADNNNAVALTDFSLLASSFGKALGDAGYDARADFNSDDVVSLTDFSLLASNFGQTGDAAP